jgi:hypothetical protein
MTEKEICENIVRRNGSCRYISCKECQFVYACVYSNCSREDILNLAKEWITKEIDETSNQNVTSPIHYTWIPGIECKDICQHFDYYTGSAIKYIWRAGKKSKGTEIQDLEKAIEMLKNKIVSIKNGQ